MYKLYFPLLKKLKLTIITTAPFILFLFLRLHSITDDMSNSDALRWHRRSEDFFQALKSRDFAETYQKYHPGVTLMWISSAAEAGLKLYSRYTHTEFKTLGNTDGYIMIDNVAKIALVFILFTLLILQYRYIELLYDRAVALLFVYLVAIEPYLIGINRWYHLTSLEVFLAFCAFLSFVLWSEFKQKHFIIKSGIFFGLALLTKFSSLFLLPVLGAVFVTSVLRDKLTSKKFYAKSVIQFALTTMVVFLALFPALWVKPLDVVRNMTNAATTAGSGEYTSVIYAEKYPYLYYLVALGYKLSPLTLILLALGLVKAFSRKDMVLRYLVFYIACQLLLLTLSEQKIERYLLSIFLPILLLCAVALARSSWNLVQLFIIVSLVSTFFVFKYFAPAYSGFYSPIFKGPKTAYQMGLYDDSGEYFRAAAEHLNKKGRDVVVYVPNNIETFSPYFKGVLRDDLDAEVDFLLVSKDSRRQLLPFHHDCDKTEKIFVNYNFAAAGIVECDINPKEHGDGPPGN